MSSGSKVACHGEATMLRGRHGIGWMIAGWLGIVLVLCVSLWAVDALTGGIKLFR